MHLSSSERRGDLGADCCYVPLLLSEWLSLINEWFEHAVLVAAQIGRKVVASAAVAVAAVAAVGCVKDGLYLLLQQMEWEHLNLLLREPQGGDMWQMSLGRLLYCCTTGVDGSLTHNNSKAAFWKLFYWFSGTFAIRAKIHCPKAVFLSWGPARHSCYKFLLWSLKNAI